MEPQVFIAKTCARLAMHFTVLKGGSFSSYLPTNELPSSITFLLSVFKGRKGAEHHQEFQLPPLIRKRKTSIHACACVCVQQTQG